MQHTSDTTTLNVDGYSSAAASPSLLRRLKAALLANRYAVVATVSPCVVLLAWDLVTRFGLVPPILLPSPGTIVTAFVDVLQNGYSGTSVFVHIGASVARILVAFLSAAALGIAIGLLRGRYRVWDAIFLVPGEVLRPIPPLGVIPLFILWFGIGEVSKILVIWLAVFLIVMLNTVAGVRSVPAEPVRAAMSLGATPVQVFRYVILPSALPQIVTGLRIGMGAALTILVASELLGGDKGLGFIILDASNFFRTNYVFVGLILIGCLGLLTDRGMTWLAKRFVHWDGKN